MSAEMIHSRPATRRLHKVLLSSVSGLAAMLALPTLASAQIITYTQGQLRQDPIVLTNDNVVLRVPTAGTVAAQSGDISGGFRITKDGVGTLVLSGANSFGSLNLAGGIVRAVNNSSLGNGMVDMSGGTQLELFNNLTISNDISIAVAQQASILVRDNDSARHTGIIEGGRLVKTGNGRLTLAGDNEHSGTTISQGRVEALTNRAFGTGVVNLNGAYIELGNVSIANDLQIGGQGVLEVIEPQEATYAGNISGGGLLLGGSGVLTLSGDNSHAATTIATDLAGSFAVRVAHDNALGSGGTYMAGGTTLIYGHEIRIANDLDIRGDNRLHVDVDQSAYQLGNIVSSFGVPGGTAFTKAGGGTLTLSGQNTHAGTAVIEEGTLVFATGGSLASTAALVIEQQGTARFGAHHNIAALRGTGVLDVGADGVSVGANGDNTTFSGDIVGAGNFAKTGTGLLQLTGDATGLTRDIDVRGGWLQADGRVGDLNNEYGGRLNVHTNATLQGSGQVGVVSVLDGGRLSGTQGQTLTLNTLSLDAGAHVRAYLGTANAVDALFAVTGDLVLDGTLDIEDLGGFGPGIYRLFSYGGQLTDNGLEIGETPGGADGLAVQTSVAGQVNLANAIAPQERLFWDGDSANWNNGRVDGGRGTWTANGATFTTMDGSSNGAMAPQPGFAIFQGSGDEVLVVNPFGEIAVTGMQFATDGYRIVGDSIGLAGEQAIIRVGDGTTQGAAYVAEIASSLTGTARLVKTDAGELILSGINSYSGGTEIRGGAIRVMNERALNGEVMNDATVIYDTSRASDMTVQATISGTGRLVKDGEGVLRIDRAQSYSGGTVVERGTLVTSGGYIRGPLANNGIVAFNEGTDATFAGNISGSGSVTKQGDGTLTLTGFNRYSGGTTVEAGLLQGDAFALQGDIAIRAGAALGFRNAQDALYAGMLTGAGQVLISGGAEMRFTGDSSAFAGSTTLSGGTLKVDGSLGGLLAIGEGGTLGGNGTVGSTTILSGGTLSPGNSTGRLTVAGDLTFAQGSRFAVEVAPGAADADLVHVTGVARLEGGSVLHVGAEGNYTPFSSYRILSAEGGLTGAFDSVSSNFAFLTPDLVYDYAGYTVDLTLARNQVAFRDRGATRNQRATAAAIDTLPTGSAVYGAIVTLPDDAALIRNAYDQLSGEIGPSIATALISDSRFLRNSAETRLRAAFGDASASSGPVMAYGPGGPRPVAADTRSFAMWSEAFGSWGAWDGDGNSARLSRDTGGMLVGADAALGDWRAGALAGYSHASFSLPGRASSGSSDNYHLGAYAGTQWDVHGGALGLRTGLAYSWHDIDTSRAVNLPGLSEALSASYDAGTFQAFGELGYRHDWGASTTFEPFANLAYVTFDADGYSEQGGAAALIAQGETNRTTFSTLGLRASHLLSAGTLETTLHGTLGWRHAFGDITPMASYSFAGSGGFTVTGVPIAKNAAVVEAGLSTAFSDTLTLGLYYTGQFASDAEDQSVRGMLNVRF